VQRGHTVEVWCPESADATYLPLGDVTVEHRLPLKVRKRRRRTFTQRLHAVTRPAPDALLEAVDAHSRTCAEEIRQGDFDLVLVAPCLFYRVPRIGRFLKDLCIPVILYLQEPRRWVYEAQPELPWIGPRESEIPTNSFLPGYWRYVLKDYFRTAEIRVDARRELEDARTYSLILVNSIFSRESIARVYGLEARVSYLGYDAQLFLNKGVPREDFILGLGSMDFIKGIDTAIETMALLPVKQRLPLVWVANSGDAGYGAQMKELADERGVDFTVRQRIDDQSLVDLLNRCRLLLYTSRLEPFGYAPLEATACGAPVVGIGEGGVREIITDSVNGLLRERDPNELAAAVTELLGNPGMARSLGENGATMAPQKFGLDIATDALIRHFERAINVSRAPALNGQRI
jgi:glycosyltransferase involved in cell wall biosynthesis